MGGMKQITALGLALTLMAAPLAAQDTDAAPIDEGFSLMEEGAKLLLRGLLQEVEPTLDEFQGMAEGVGEAMQLLGAEMGPALAELLGQIDDMRHYDAPAILPNGDIIIRRKPDAPDYQPEETTDLGEIEL